MEMRPLIVLLCLLSAAVASAAATPPSGLVPPGPYTGPGLDEAPDGWQTMSNAVHKQCGKYQLVFRNPDLREDADDFIHAQGQFFIQFQVVGEGSDEVTKMSFSFGVTDDALYENPPVNCNTAIPANPLGQGTGGVYLLYYRSDFDPKDGFFVPILTNNVPDGEYAAAVHAYNAAGDEVSRAWARAIVDNCPGTGNERCAVDDPAAIPMDKTMPWPIVLPGDGEQTNDVGGLTVEFGEAIKNETLEVSVNGASVPLQDWTPQARDTDVLPTNDDQDCPHDQAPVCSRAQYGPGFHWQGQLLVGDVIRVGAQDMNGNFAEKILHYGKDTSGGTVDLTTPNVELTATNGASVAIRPGDVHEFNIRLQNSADAEAHVSLTAEYDEATGFEAHWTDLEGARADHVVVAPRGEVVHKVRVQTQPDVTEQVYQVKATARYDSEGLRVEKAVDLRVDVDKNAGAGHQASHGNGTAPATTTTTAAAPATAEDDGGGLPGPGWLLVVAAVISAIALSTRRRRSA